MRWADRCAESTFLDGGRPARSHFRQSWWVISARDSLARSVARTDRAPPESRYYRMVLEKVSGGAPPELNKPRSAAIATKPAISDELGAINTRKQLSLVPVPQPSSSTSKHNYFRLHRMERSMAQKAATERPWSSSDRSLRGSTSAIKPRCTARPRRGSCLQPGKQRARPDKPFPHNRS